MDATNFVNNILALFLVPNPYILDKESNFSRFCNCDILNWNFRAKNHENQENTHTIRKVNFFSKNSILTKPQHFHEFFTQIVFDHFSREIKVVNS